MATSDTEVAEDHEEEASAPAASEGAAYEEEAHIWSIADVSNFGTDSNKGFLETEFAELK